jgi:hypothetical protein
MSNNYNSALQSNNVDLQAILNTINELPEAGSGGEQATPEISVNSTNGLITATAGTKSSTHQLAFQPAKTITPSTTSQVAVSSGYYTGGNITVAAVPTQAKTVTPKASTQNVTPDSGKFLSKVTVNGDSNLVAGNIKSGVSIFGVTGTLVEGGSGGDGYDEADSLITMNMSTYTNNRVTSIGIGAFAFADKLQSANFNKVLSIGRSAFYDCSSLTTVSFPACKTIEPTIGYGGAFYDCDSLTTASFPACTTIGSLAFYKCYNLKSLYLTGSTLCTLLSSDAFSSTPIGGYSASAGTYGSIYVPASLLTSYKTATNWTYFSSRFVGI